MPSARVTELLAAMTPPEQVSLLSGEDFWSTPAIARLGIAISASIHALSRL